MRRHCLTLDLKDDASLIAKYIEYHENVWPEVLDSIRDSGIMEMEIYSIENRLFMIIEVNEDFSFEKKSEMDANNPRVQDWEVLMWNYQKALPFAKPGEKWIPMHKIFDFND